MHRGMRALLGAGGLLLTFAAIPADAVTFILNNTGGAGTGTAALKGFQAAANFWGSTLKDNVTVRLNIGFKSLGANIIGQTSMSTGVAYVSDVYAALAADRTDALDNAAVASLRPLSTIASGNYAGMKQLTMTVNQTQASSNNYSDKATRVDSDGSGNNIALAATTANLKALGFSLSNPSAADASITFNSSFAFDFDPTNGISSGQVDFVGVAIHEIGHALGFVSGVDTYDAYTSPTAAASGTNKAGTLDPYAIGSVLDLYRYSAAGTLDWSTSSTAKYLSVNGGTSAYNGNAYFSLGATNGDGYQASHWRKPTGSTCTGLVGVMNPYACNSTMAVVTTDDLAAMDVIGWNVDTSKFGTSGSFTSAQAFSSLKVAVASVPETGTWAMMLAGFGVLGGVARQRRAVRFARA